MLKKILRIIRNILISILFLILIVGGIYLVNPEYVENKAVEWFYPTVNIDDKYLNRIAVEIPEVYELMQIASTLTDAYQNDRNQINKNTIYYKEVEAQFMKFRNHELVKKLNDYLLGNLYGGSPFAIRLLSLNYNLTNNKLISSKTINANVILIKLFQSQAFMISENINIIENFAQETNFKDFYNNHKDYYSKLINNFHKLCKPEDIKKWLERKFVNKYQSYRIIFSPLTGGFHNTEKFYDNQRNAEQTFMFISAPDYNIDELSKEDYEIKASEMTRIVFTEIDHNYVNPLTDNYLKELDSAIPDYKFWNNKTKGMGYKSNYGTFNEYMTWGVFSLYAMDTYSHRNVDTIITIQTNIMSRNRQFIHFREFNDELIKQYIEKSKPHIDSLYYPMLEWMKQKYVHQKDFIAK